MGKRGPKRDEDRDIAVGIVKEVTGWSYIRIGNAFRVTGPRAFQHVESSMRAVKELLTSYLKGIK